MYSNSKELLHMLFHILGRYHEHERADRDRYIDVILDNIIEGMCTCAYLITTNIFCLAIHVHVY